MALAVSFLFYKIGESFMSKKLLYKEEGRLKIFDVEFYYLWLLGILFAFVGFVGENTFKAFTDGYIDSRFHILPFIGCYALVPFAIYIALGSTDDLRLFGYEIFKNKDLKSKILSNILCFLIISTFVFLGELLIGNMWEYFFNVKLWDYSGMFLAITQYTCLFATVLYGGLAYLFFKFIFNPLLKLFKAKISYKAARIICLSLGSLLIIDELRLMITIMLTNSCPHFWKIVFFS